MIKMHLVLFKHAYSKLPTIIKQKNYGQLVYLATYSLYASEILIFYYI